VHDQVTTGAPDGHRTQSGEPSLADRARELAAAADQLKASITAFHADLRAGDESTRRAGFRCDTAKGWAASITDDMHATASDLDRIAAASTPGTCSIPWGACPDHGGTLRSTGGRTWCVYPGCGRQWDYDRGGLPCTETAAWTVTDKEGGSGAVCAGHAVDIRKHDWARLTPIASTGQHRAGGNR
jgi:hypothetical protein